MNIVRAFFFQNQGILFQFWKRQGRPSPLPLSSQASLIFCQFFKTLKFFKSKAKIGIDKFFIRVTNFNLRMSILIGCFVTNQQVVYLKVS